MASSVSATARDDRFYVDSPLSTPLATRSAAEGPQLGDGLALRLRKATAKAHQEVMQPAIVAKLVSGQLPQEMHLRYLMMLYSIYSALEDALALHSTHPLLCAVYQPALLARAPALDSDCAYFARETAWRRESIIWRELEDDTPPSLDAYVGRLEELARNHDDDKSATLLLAHAYVRYLGDLSGGQAIARTIRQTYDLPSTGEGSSFYEFYVTPTSPSTTGLPTPAGPNETREIKAWFRAGLDAAGERMTEDERAAVIREARYAFELNIGVFASFEAAMAKWELERAAEHAHKAAAKGALTARKAESPLQETGTLTWIGVGVAVLLALFVGLRDWGVLRI